MYIGTLAKLTGTTPKAIRLYEQIGLLTPVQRKGSYRIYSEKNVEQVRLIRQAKALGFKLSELQPVPGPGESEPDWQKLVSLLMQKRRTIAEEIDRLHALDRQLANISEEIQTCLADRQSATSYNRELCDNLSFANQGGEIS